MNRKKIVILSVSEKSREKNRFLTSFGMTEKNNSPPIWRGQGVVKRPNFQAIAGQARNDKYFNRFLTTFGMTEKIKKNAAKSRRDDM